MVRAPLTSILIAGLLAGCGGGSSTSTPLPPPVITLAQPATTATLAGGKPIALEASADNGAALTWQLGAGAPGSLSASSGTKVNYLPPAGGLPAPAAVPITVSAGGASKMLTLAVAPDPGAAQLIKLADIASLHNGQPTMYAPFFVAGDGNGNLYIGEQLHNVSPSRQTGLAISKLGADGTLSRLFDQTAAGQIRYVRDMAADRAGNVYVIAGTPGGGQLGVEWYGVAIYKITAAGELSILAGDVISQTGAITDGLGKAARFLDPKLAGIDPDGNLYINDALAKVRRVTPEGMVTTIATLPAAVGADMNGNHYAASAEQNVVTKVGSDTVVAGKPGCKTVSPGPLPSCIGSPFRLVQLDAASYAMITIDDSGGFTIMKMVVPH
ncbi:MAG: hypothetical protein K0R43_3913 [Pseudoduganella sp.]|jgi:hypothetical protein|nr:hypothetical protein [Pseudoduganella sp.]